MLRIYSILASIIILFVVHIEVSCGDVSCTVCPAPIVVNLTSDADINTDNCKLESFKTCSLILRIDYTNINDSFALIDGSPATVLVLTNGAPQVSQETFIWFNEMRVQRMANILCFSGTSCGIDQLKQIYRDEFRLFKYRMAQGDLANQLYSSSAPTTSLTCFDQSGSIVNCQDGFCRSITDGNGIVVYSSCVKRGPIPNPYGLIVTKSTLADFGQDQISVMFTCNKPLCNSQQSTRDALQKLASVNIIPQPTITTTRPNNGAEVSNHAKAFSFVFAFLCFLKMNS